MNSPAQDQTPAVSVVVPTRDRPELLRSAIAAILGQDYAGSIEVVVVFDQAEPDLTLEVADPHRGVRVIRNTRSQGLAGGRNSGILATTGDLVAFCDDDDEWMPGKLAAQVAALRSVPGAEFVATGIQVQYTDHKIDRVLTSDRITLQMLLRDRMTELHPSTFLMTRAAVVDGFGLVDEEIPGSYAEDYEFLLRAAKRVPLVNISVPYVVVRWHAKSYFSQRWEMISKALQWLLERYPEFATEPAGEARVTGQIAFARAASGERREAMRWARHTLSRNMREPRAYLAMVVASRVVKPDTVLRALHKRGRGI